MNWKKELPLKMEESTDVKNSFSSSVKCFLRWFLLKVLNVDDYPCVFK